MEHIQTGGGLMQKLEIVKVVAFYIVVCYIISFIEFIYSGCQGNVCSFLYE